MSILFSDFKPGTNASAVTKLIENSAGLLTSKFEIR